MNSYLRTSCATAQQEHPTVPIRTADTRFAQYIAFKPTVDPFCELESVE